MRNIRFDLLCAGAMLALIAVAPTPSSAAPERIRQVVPLPPSVNGQIIRRHREAAPVPPPPAPSRRSTPAPAPVAQTPVRQEPVAQEPVAQVPAAQVPPAQIPQTPAAADNAGAAGLIMSTLDKLFAASDAQITEKLRDTVTAKSFGKRIQHADERKATENFYAERQYAPLWIHDGRLTARAKAMIARLKDAAADGLDASDYPVPAFGNDADALADGDIKLTQSVLTFSRHLAIGRIAPTRVSAEVDYGDHTPEPADILKKISEARDVNATLDSFDPPQAGFKALKAKLAELRSGEARAEANDRIPDGPTIKLGAKDTRVPLLRERLNVTFAPRPETIRVRDKRTGRIKLIKLPKNDDPAAELVYDKALFKAIKNIQARADIKATGLIGKRTLAAINGPSHAQTIEILAANMERWRWLPRDLGKTYVMVNIPDYSLKVMRDDRQVWTTKIVAGKPQTPTPLLSASMDNVIINPSWYVPQSIIQNEYLPLYENDPNIFDRLGLEVRRGSDGHINVVQPPGAANALGRIKFNFPNKFHVYLFHPG